MVVRGLERPSWLIRKDLKLYLDIYEVEKNFCYVGIYRDNVTKRIIYEVMEPTLTEEEKQLLERIKRLFVDEVDEVALEPKKIGSEELYKYVEEMFEKVIKKHGVNLPKPTKMKLLYYLKRDLAGYGKIHALMKDPFIEDISCNGPGIPIYVWHRIYESIETNVKFENNRELDEFISRLVYLSGRHISLSQPIVDAILPDNSRLLAALGGRVSDRGSNFTIRRTRADPFTVVDLIKLGTMSLFLAAYLWFVIDHYCSIMIAGAPAAGKTTTLNVLANFIPSHLKIVSLEETREIFLEHENWVPMVTSQDIDLFELFKASLRQRPDYIIIGEIRGREAYAWMQALATGKLGMTTIHAESPAGVIHRLTSEPMNIPKVLIPSLNLIIVQRRISREFEGMRMSVRRIVNVTEITGMDPVTERILTNQVFEYDPYTDKIKYLGRSYLIEKIVREHGLREEDVRKELDNRMLILKWLIEKGKRHIKEVANIVRTYYYDKEYVLSMVRGE